MSKGWFWRGNVAAYDFRVGKERYRGTLAIRKDSGPDKDGKTPSQKADEEVMSLKVQLQQKMTVSEVWSQMRRRLIGDHALPVAAKNVVEVFFKKVLPQQEPDEKNCTNSGLRSSVTGSTIVTRKLLISQW